MITNTLFEIKNKEGQLIASNLPENYYFNKADIINKIITAKCPITTKGIRHGFFETANGLIYISSYTVPTNKILKRYFEACDFFIPTLEQSISIQKTKTKNNFRRFKHNLVSHHTTMLQEMERAFPIDNADKGIHNQIDFVMNIIQENPKESALAILRVIKSVNLMKAEFDVYDMLSLEHPNLEIYTHNPHKLLLLVLNPFWLEFIEKGVRIDVKECDGEISVDYKSISVVFSHIFENASKYIARDSIFKISFANQDDFIDIHFDMTSLKIKPDEKEKIFIEEYSGEFSKSISLAGNGIGLSIVKKLVEYNNGLVKVQIDTDQNQRIKIMNIPFERNSFIISLPKKRQHIPAKISLRP
jgi:signal transduction histidine kinase